MNSSSVHRTRARHVLTVLFHSSILLLVVLVITGDYPLMAKDVIMESMIVELAIE